MAKSKKKQLQDLEQKEHDKKYGRTAKKTPKQTEENQKPYTTPLPGAPKGHNIARKGKGPNSVNV